MTTTLFPLSLPAFGPVSGQLFTPARTNGQSLSRLIILLHGWGADGADVLPLAPDLVDGGRGDSVFVPDAPYVCSANPFGRQWFELADVGEGLQRNAAACTGAAGLIAALLDSLSAETGVASDQMVLGGFSQGGMVSLTGGLAYHKPLCGLFCLSGAWLTMDQPIHQPASLPVFLAHGAADPVVPVQGLTAAEAGLSAAGFSPQTLIRPDMAHGIDGETVRALAGFLAQGL